MENLLNYPRLPRSCFLTDVTSIYISPRTFLLCTNHVCRAVDCSLCGVAGHEDCYGQKDDLGLFWAPPKRLEMRDIWD